LATETVDTILDPKLARAILAEVAEGGWLDTNIPEEEKDLVELTSYYINKTKQWVEDGNPSDRHINAIIGLATVTGTNSPPVLSETVENTNEEVPPGEILKEDLDWENAILADEVAATYPRRSSGGYSEDDLRVDKDLPIPSPLPEGAPLEMPTDLTEVGDKPLRRLYSAFTSYWGRARWKLGVATNNLVNATHLRDEVYRSTYIKELREAAIAGEKVTQAALENSAKNTEGYKAWDQRVTEHEQEINEWRALADIYSKNVEVLSREWTMRTEQYERER